jgi:hypothetical protein
LEMRKDVAGHPKLSPVALVWSANRAGLEWLNSAASGAEQIAVNSAGLLVCRETGDAHRPFMSQVCSLMGKLPIRVLIS